MFIFRVRPNHSNIVFPIINQSALGQSTKSIWWLFFECRFRFFIVLLYSDRAEQRERFLNSAIWQDGIEITVKFAVIEFVKASKAMPSTGFRFYGKRSFDSCGTVASILNDNDPEREVHPPFFSLYLKKLRMLEDLVGSLKYHFT